MAKIPENDYLNEIKRKTLKRIQVTTATVIANKRFLTPITLQVIPNKGIYNIDVSQAHRNIFSAMKMNDPTLKIITPQNKIIDTLL